MFPTVYSLSSFTAPTVRLHVRRCCWCVSFKPWIKIFTYTLNKKKSLLISLEAGQHDTISFQAINALRRKAHQVDFLSKICHFWPYFPILTPKCGQKCRHIFERIILNMLLKPSFYNRRLQFFKGSIQDFAKNFVGRKKIIFGQIFEISNRTVK